MPVPSPRNKILPARGNFSDLSTNVASLSDGEICYAIDQDQYYQNEGGTLVSVGANKAQGALADSAVQPTDSIDILADVDISTTAPTDGQALIWDNAGGKFVPGEAGLVDSVNTQTGDVVLDTDDIAEGTTNLYSQWDNVTGGINYADGNVGIGTTSPEANLHVYGSDLPELRIEDQGEYVSLLYNDNGSTLSIGVLNADYGNTSVADTELRIGVDGASRYVTKADGSHTFYQTDGSTESMRITSDGKVGIGTTVPQSIFVVRGNTPRITLEPTGETQNTRIQFALADGTVKSRITGGGSDGDAIRFSQGSNERMRVNSGGNIGIGTTAPGQKLHVSGGNILIDSNKALRFGQSDAAFIEASGSDGSGGTRYMRFAVNSEALRIDSGVRRLLVGTSSARANFYNGSNTAQIQLEGTNFQNAAFAITCNANSPDKGGLIFAKSRGTTVGSNTVVQDGDSLGAIDFQGADGSEFVSGANIKAEVDGTPGADDMPGRLVFSTTADGASSPTERMRIKNDGTINFSNVAVYADNTAAKAGGLVDGDVYRTSTGDLKIVYT